MMIDILFYLPQLLALFCALWFFNLWLRCCSCCNWSIKNFISLFKSVFYIIVYLVAVIFVTIRKFTLTCRDNGTGEVAKQKVAKQEDPKQEDQKKSELDELD